MTNDIPALAAAVREVAPGRADPRRRDLGAGCRAVRDGRVGPGPRGHRARRRRGCRAPGHGHGGRGAARLGRRRDARGCRASTSTSSATATPPANGETPVDARRSRSMYQVDEGLRLMQAEGDGVFARHAACQAMTRAGLRAHRLRAARGRRRRQPDRDRGLDPGRAWTGRPSTPALKRARPGARRRPGQAQGQDLPARAPGLGHDGRHPRRRSASSRRPPSSAASTSRPGAAVAAAQRALARRPRGPAMRILVVEPLAAEGIELLRRHHDVDEKLGLAARGDHRDPARLRRARRPQPGQGRRRADRRGHPARRHRPGRRRRGQRGPRGRDPGRHRRRQRPHRQHDRRRGAHARAAVRARAQDRRRRRVDAPGRVEALRSSRASRCAARPWASSGLGKIGQAIAVRARAMQMTVLGSDPFVTPEQAANLGVELVTFDDLVARADAITVHVPKTKGDDRPDQRRRHRADEARRPAAQRRARRRHRRGGPRRRPARRPGRRRRDRRLHGGAADGLPAPRRAEHAAHAAPGRVHRRGPGRGGRGGRGADPRRARRALRRGTRSTRRC